MSLFRIIEFRMCQTLCRIIFHSFLFYDAEMHRKLWLKALAKEGALGQNVNKFSSLPYKYKFFEKPNKKCTVELKSYTAMLLISVFRFVIVYLTEKHENWKMAQGYRLSPPKIWKQSILLVLKIKIVKIVV